MKKSKLLAIALCALQCSLMGCGKDDFSKQAALMVSTLEEKYEEDFHVVDITSRPTSDLNSQGDVYYAYVVCDSKEKLQNRGFYCELNSSMTSVKDSFLNVKLQPALEGRYAQLTPEDSVIVGLTSVKGNEIMSKYTYKNIVVNSIPYTVVAIIPTTADNIVTFSGETEVKKFERMLKELINSDSSVSASIVYCDEEYVEEYKNFLNHMQPFDYKVQFAKIYADVSLNVTNGNLSEQFITQLNNDLAKYKIK